MGSRHGLHNTGDGNLDWLVIEISSPHTAAALFGLDHHASEERMSGAAVYPLTANAEIDPTGILTGPLRRIRMAVLKPHAAETLTSDDTEHTVFVLRGSGTVTVGTARAELRPGVAVTLPLGAKGEFTAGADGLEFFHTELAVSIGSGKADAA
ncbi:hypothetical protein [Carbonactinospora thermoautotrophica]|uniref:hypothetical protein n=1 Tax=Carbonactinospora thermoautotrophica TaxID=1469144 RepID=UPI0018E366E0|nr:hypothetical protein [Carbonactinospora thermoautotrophica]